MNRPFDLPAYLRRSQESRAKIMTDPDLDATTRLLFDVQYAQQALEMTLLHSGMDMQQVMQIVYNIQNTTSKSGN